MKKSILAVTFGLLVLNSISQEGVRELHSNPSLRYKDLSENSDSYQHLSSLKSSSNSIQLPFKDDFYYATLRSYPNMTLWQDSLVYINAGYPIAPPSIGVATFDGLNKFGYPYEPNYSNLSESRPADTLQSRGINLNSSGAQILQPSDSIALSFYYQARGNGEPPESGDSLLLDFYKPLDSVWIHNVWFSKGNSNPNTNDTVFKRAFIWITDTAYLNDNFMFRFRNKASTAGNFDHWHIDYVYLNKNRSMKADTVYNDLTFAHVPSSFLKNYSSMPYQQYVASEMAQKNSVRIRNNGSQTIAMSYENRFYNKQNTLIHSYNGGADNLAPFKPNGYSSYAPHANPTFAYTFPNLTDSSDFTIKHFLYRSQGTSSDFIIENDTIYQKQIFRNYYAYDDGSAEGGYYVNAVSGKIALKFSLNFDDTLRAIRIYFDPAGALNSVEQISKFRIYIWANNSGNPGNVIYKDSVMYPKYIDSSFKAIPQYSLTSKVFLNGGGTYFIGIQQEVASGIVIGFDKNQDRHENLYYNLGSGWTQSQIKGSLMLHPVFGKFIPSPASIKESGQREIQDITIFPNPTSENFTVLFDKKSFRTLMLINSIGQVVQQYTGTENQYPFGTQNLDEGLYFLRVIESGKETFVNKIILQR